MTRIVERLSEGRDEAQHQVQQAFVSPRTERRRGRVFLLVWFAALVGYLCVLVLVRSNRSAEADLAATIRMQKRDHPSINRLMGLVSWFGFRPQSLMLPGLAVVGTWLLRLRVESVFLVMAWGSSFLSFLTKLVVRRPRPTNPLVRVIEANIRDTSFPSGHTLHYVAFWGFFSYLLSTKLRYRTARWTSVGLIGSLIALVGPSRVYLGHHWLTDVLGSYLLGIAYLLGLVALYRRVQPWLASDGSYRTLR